MRKIPAGIGLVTIAALALGACGGGDGKKLGEDIVKDVAGGSVDISIDDSGGGSIDVGGDNGGSINIGGGELPDELADFPIPDGAEVVASVSGSTDSGSGSMVTLAANGDYKEVSSDMQSQLEGSGFTITGDYEMENGGIGTRGFSFEGKGLQGTTIVIEEDSVEGYNLSISIVTGS